MCLADSRLFLPGLNLAYTDRASMAASTEVRVPFVDPVVFRAAFSLPGDQKVHGRTQKFALKEAARRWLPKEVVERPKASFSAPLRAWVAHDLRELIDDVLVRGELVETGFLRRQARGHAHRRGTQRSRGPVQAHLAAADPRAVVPPGPPGRSAALAAMGSGPAQAASPSTETAYVLVGDGPDQGAGVGVHLGERVPTLVDDQRLLPVTTAACGLLKK